MAGFAPVLRPYLRYLGTCYVAVTGDPAAVRDAAQVLARTAEELDATRRRLDEHLALVLGWSGHAQDAFSRRHAIAVKALEVQAGRCRRASELLAAHADVATKASGDIQQIVLAFLRDAETAYQRARAVPYAAGGGPVVAFRTMLEQAFAVRKAEADAVVQAFRDAVRPLGPALDELTPTIWQRIEDAWDEVTATVGQWWDDALHSLEGFSVDRFIAARLQQLADGLGVDGKPASGYYYGFTLTPRGVYLPMYAGAAAIGALGLAVPPLAPITTPIAAGLAAVGTAALAVERVSAAATRGWWVPALNVAVSTDTDWNVGSVAVRVMPKHLDESSSVWVGRVDGLEWSDGKERLVQAGAIYLPYVAEGYDVNKRLPEAWRHFPGVAVVDSGVVVVKNGYTFVGNAVEGDLTWGGIPGRGKRLITLPPHVGADGAAGLWFNVGPIRRALGGAPAPAQ